MDDRETARDLFIRLEKAQEEIARLQEILFCLVRNEERLSWELHDWDIARRGLNLTPKETL